MNLKQLVREYLKTNGYDGLVNTDICCGCLLDDLCPCDSAMDDCEPGYKEQVSADDQCDCPGDGKAHWHIVRKHPAGEGVK